MKRSSGIKSVLIKLSIFLSILSLILISDGLAQEISPASALHRLSAHDLLTWPRTSADDFGCFLEESFSFKNKKFNCSLKNYKNLADPCRNPEEYYEGPAFPDNKAGLVNPSIKEIHLNWEHGTLQSMEVVLAKNFSEASVRKMFHLSPKGQPLPPNVMQIDVTSCSSSTTCLDLEGFEHMGSSDVECTHSPLPPHH